MNKEGLSKNFITYLAGKKKQSLYLKLFFVSTIVIVIASFYYSYRIAVGALDKVIVVSTGGEMLPQKSMEQDQLYKSLLTTHCYSVAYYANSFDINNIKNNQAHAAFLVNQADLNSIAEKYQYDKAYSDVINKGVIYTCKFDHITLLQIVGNGSEYNVSFISILTVIDGGVTSKFKILSKGVAIRTTPRYPENPTGFYFKSYTQEYSPFKDSDQ